MADKTRITITLLVVLVVLLVGFVVYSFVIQPAIQGYAVQRQTEGVQIAVSEILKVVAQCQAFPLTVGNQTINLVALECLKQPQQVQEQGQTQGSQ